MRLFSIIIIIVAISILHFLATPSLRNYEKIYLGMEENEMLKIMGGHPNKTLFKDGRIKYEWRIRSSSFSHSNIRVYNGTKIVSIYVKNGLVEEVRPTNV